MNAKKRLIVRHCEERSNLSMRLSLQHEIASFLAMTNNIINKAFICVHLRSSVDSFFLKVLSNTIFYRDSKAIKRVKSLRNFYRHQ